MSEMPYVTCADGENLHIAPFYQQVFHHESSQPKTCQVGPMTFTYQQLLTDRRIVLSSAAVSLTDGGEALYADDTNVYESISAISDTVASRYSLTDHSMTWLEAAQELELPLYGVRALVELPPESDLGSSMEDALWNEDGTIVYFNMPMLAPGSAAGDVNATLYMAVTQFDPATGEALEKWETREEVTLPVAPLLEEKTYLPQENATFDGLTLESVVDRLGIERDGDFHNALDDALYTTKICRRLPLAQGIAEYPDPAAQLTAALLNNTDTETYDIQTYFDRLDHDAYKNCLLYTSPSPRDS